MSSPVLFLVTNPAAAQRTADGSEPGFGRADPSAPQLSVLELGATHGDGVFESISVIDGRMPPLELRFDRFASSALALDLPVPHRPTWTAAITAAIDAHDAVHALAVTLVLTRGVEGAAAPRGWVLARPARDFAVVREEGVRVVTLDRGYRHDAADSSPWLLLGAKHLSYAVNAAALREARRRGADDVIFASADGLALEGPTSSLIVRRGETVLTPSLESGILAGTTQTTVFSFFAGLGYRTAFASIPAAELPAADALWLVSSVRQAVAVRSIDGHELGVDDALTRSLNDYITAHASE